MAKLDRADRVRLATFGLGLGTSCLTDSERKLKENGYLSVRKKDGLHTMYVKKTKKGEEAAERWLPQLAKTERATLSEEALEDLMERRPNEELVEARLGFVPAGPRKRFVPNKVGKAVIALLEEDG